MSEQGINYWVRRLVREDMPLFSRTVEHVAAMANKEDYSFSELAWSILEDPALTSRVLKLANSMYYNPGSKRITTVSRAVMRLGTNAIREICLAISLIETVLSGNRKEKVAVEVARSFHAAVQARKMAVLLNLPDPEEIFIAALLARIGNIAFWCFADGLGPRLESAMIKADSEERAEMEVLGFKLQRLTERLSREWKLSDLLERALRDKSDTDPRVRSIKLGCAVAMTSEKGWDCPEVGKTIKEVSDYLRLSEMETVEILHESARYAAEVTESYGMNMFSRLVPVPEEGVCEKSGQAEENKISEEIASSCETETNGRQDRPTAMFDTPREERYPEPDPSIQLGSLRDLSTLMSSGGAEVNMVLSIMLEGIYRGIGMDRVVFVLLTPDRRHLKGKHGLGCIDGGWVENLTINANADTPNVFGYVLKNRRPLWVTERPEASIKPLLTEELFKVIGGAPYFVMPVSIKDVAIGVIYADRKPSGRTLDEESFENFTFFGQQANMCLSVLSSDSRKPFDRL
ncbi:MAG: HDOD domain-containing protein [Deltaproteobacteria bacterium]|jgi:HD-like signal output (HDOD) protein|nr:HDOD domain-containing protein [Deltaproteobacteria bacterium]